MKDNYYPIDMEIRLTIIVLFLSIAVLSCSKQNELCEICGETTTQIDSSSFLQSFDFVIPNTMLTDDQELGAFSFTYSFADEDMNVVLIPVIDFEVFIYDNEGNEIAYNDDIYYLIEHNSIMVWDGSTLSNDYVGKFSYDMYLEFPNDQYISVRGTAHARSCELINECISDESSLLDLHNCRFHGYLTQTAIEQDCI